MGEKTTTAPLKQASPESTKWYEDEGWQVFNQLLAYLDAKRLNTVYVENFNAVNESLRKVPKRDVMALFNGDSYSWRLDMDDDGVLVARKI